MGNLEIIKVSSYDDVIVNLDKLFAAFERDGVFVLRGHSFTQDEHIGVVQKLGDKYNWSLNSEANSFIIESAIYPGGHSSDPNMNIEHTKDDYLLDWHIEQVYYIYPILAGAWNMTRFTADKGVGNTRFVDSTWLYKNLSKADQEFLAKVVVFWDKPLNTGKGPFYTKAVDTHPYNGEPVLRVETDRGCIIHPTLHLVDKNPPTSEEIARFSSIMSSIKDELNNNEEIRLTQEWEQGDLLIVDLFRMYHAVMGGFRYNERVFTGIGVRPKLHDNSLYTDMEKLWTES